MAFLFEMAYFRFEHPVADFATQNCVLPICFTMELAQFKAINCMIAWIADKYR